jgi:hypothetical protein
MLKGQCQPLHASKAVASKSADVLTCQKRRRAAAHNDNSGKAPNRTCRVGHKVCLAQKQLVPRAAHRSLNYELLRQRCALADTFSNCGQRGWKDVVSPLPLLEPLGCYHCIQHLV